MTIKQECCWYVFVFYKRFVLILFCLCIYDVYVYDIDCSGFCSCCKQSNANNTRENDADEGNDNDGSKIEDDKSQKLKIDQQFSKNLNAFNAALDDATNNVYDVKIMVS